MADAASMKPKFIPDANLLARDDSGGMEYEPHNAQWGDGGNVTGAKSYLSVSGGRADSTKNDELDDGPEPSGLSKEGRGTKDNSSTASRRKG